MMLVVLMVICVIGKFSSSSYFYHTNTTQKILPYAFNKLIYIISQVVEGLQLSELSYRIHEVQIDNHNQFRAAIFSFTFDEGTYNNKQYY